MTLGPFRIIVFIVFSQRERDAFPEHANVCVLKQKSRPKLTSTSRKVVRAVVLPNFCSRQDSCILMSPATDTINTLSWSLSLRCDIYIQSRIPVGFLADPAAQTQKLQTKLYVEIVDGIVPNLNRDLRGGTHQNTGKKFRA